MPTDELNEDGQDNASNIIVDEALRWHEMRGPDYRRILLDIERSGIEPRELAREIGSWGNFRVIFDDLDEEDEFDKLRW